MSKRTGKHRIYMNVGYDLTEQQLRDFFNQYGNVTDVYLPKHKSGRNKGFGFTTFDSEDGLRSALSAQEYMIGGMVVKINRAGPRPDFEASSLEGADTAADEADSGNRQPQLFGKGPRLYVGGVPEELTVERLKAHFSRWGSVVDLYFPGKKGQSRVNYCFVTFDNWRAAQKACNQSERNIDGMVSPCNPILLYHLHPAKLFLMPTLCLQPLQSINLAQERTAEQEQQARAAAASQGTTPPASGAPADYGVSDLGSASDLAFLQQLRMQAQLQAQQSGYSPQQHAHLQSILAGQSMASLPPAVSAYPGAYQQMINSLLAQQSTAGTAVHSPGMFQTPPTESLHAYNLPAAASLAPSSFPQGLGSMHMDLGQLLAAQAQAQAAGHHASSMYMHSQPSVVPDASRSPYGMPLGAGTGLGPSLQSTASGDLASNVNPAGWGWGSSTDNFPLPQAPRGKSHSAPHAHSEDLLAQAQANAWAAASAQSNNHGPMQLPYGGEVQTRTTVTDFCFQSGHNC